MGKGSDIKAGQAYVLLYGKDSLLNKALKSAGSKIKEIGGIAKTTGKWLTGIGASLTAPLTAAAASWAAAGSELLKMSQTTGLSAEALSALKYAAQETGVDFEAAAGGMRKMQKAIYSAATGSTEARSNFATLGLSVADLAKMSPEQQFEAIAEGISKIGNPTEKAAMAMAMFGKTGTELLPMLQQGAAGLAALRQEAGEAGVIKTKEELLAARELTLAYKHLATSVSQIKNAIGKAVAPILTGIARSATVVVRQIRDWVKANPELFRGMLLVGGALTAAGTALLAIGTGATVAVAALSGLGAVLAGAMALLGALTSPIMLVIGGIAALAAAFVDWEAAADSAINWIAGQFAEFAAETKATFGVIAAALAQGDIRGAAKVGLAYIRLEWARATAWIKGLWGQFTAWWTGLTFGLAEVFVNVVAMFRSAWQDAIAWLTKKWEAFCNSAFTENVADALTPIIAAIQGLDPEDVRKTLHQDFKRARAAQPARDANIDAERDAAKAKIEADRAANIANLDKERAAQKAADIAKATEDVATALEEWNKAKDEVAANAAESKRQRDEEIKRQQKAGAGGIGDIIAAKTSTHGTFSGEAAWGLGGNTTAATIARATELTAKNTSRLLGKARPLVFVN